MLSDVGRQAAGTSGPLREMLTFRVATQDFCVEIRQVKEIRGWTPATLLPDSPAYLRGVINLRGAILPIVDMRARLSLPEAEDGVPPVVIVVWIGRRLAGLVVDAVCDILAVTDDALEPTPDLSDGVLASLIAGLVTDGDRMVGLLALDRLLPEPESAVP